MLDIRIIGLGNVLMGDDGFGPYVIEALTAGYDFPSNVTVTDVGTPGLDLTPFLLGADAVIVIDSIRSEGAPGAIRSYRRDKLLAHAPQQRLGPHDPGFKQTLLTLDFAGCAPRDVLLVGAIPLRVLPRARLSPTMRAAVPGAIRAVVIELARLDAAPTPKHTPSPVAPWWERGNFPAIGDIPRC